MSDIKWFRENPELLGVSYDWWSHNCSTKPSIFEQTSPNRCGWTVSGCGRVIGLQGANWAIPWRPQHILCSHKIIGGQKLIMVQFVWEKILLIDGRSWEKIKQFLDVMYMGFLEPSTNFKRIKGVVRRFHGHFFRLLIDLSFARMLR